MTRELAALALLCGASWPLGSAALAGGAWADLRIWEQVCLRLTAGLGLSALGLSLLALAGGLAGAPVVLGLVALAGALLTLRGWWPLEPFSGADTSVPSWSRVLSGVMAATALLACLGTVAPVTDDDALAYVLPIARRIASTGTLMVWPDQARSMWPMSQEVLLASVIQTGGTRLGVLTALEWILVVGTVSAMARRTCAQPAHIGVALVVGLGAPVLAFQIPSGKEDLLLLALTAGTACALSGSAPRTYRAAGLLAGLAAGAKYPGLGVVLAVVAWPLISRGSARARASATTAGWALLAGGLWYGLNLWRYGNPVAPFAATWFGGPVEPAGVEELLGNFGYGPGLVPALLAPLHLFLDPAHFTSRANLFNPLVYAGLAALATPEARRRHAPLLFISVVLYAGWVTTLQNSRLLLPAAVLLAPAAADALVPLFLRRRALKAVAVGVAVVSLGVVAAVGAVRLQRFATDSEGFLARETQNYSDVQWMNTHLDRTRHRVGTEHRSLDLLMIPWLHFDPTHQIEIADHELRDPVQFLAACRRQGITHLFGTDGNFAELEAHLTPVYRNPSSRLGGIRFFRDAPSESTVLYELQK